MDDGRSRDNLWAAASRFSGIGLQWAMSVLLFLAFGWWLDGVFGVTPFFTIVGAFVGGGAGFYSMYFHLVVEPRRKVEEEDRG